MYRVLVDLDANNFYACLGLCYCLLQGPNWMEAQPVLAQLPQLAKSPEHQNAIARLMKRWDILRSASPADASTAEIASA